MYDSIYTIPVSEAFDACAETPANGCPFCFLKSKLENERLDLILGASMMEPDVRIKTNELGFCRHHLEEMAERKNRLGLALMLESHLDELRSELTESGISSLIGSKGKKSCARIERLEETCYVCECVEETLGHMLENAAALWDSNRDFRATFKEQPYFCLPHFRALVNAARGEVSKKRFSDFYDEAAAVMFKYMDELRADVSWFAKKFDYRYDDQPWGNAKNAIERAIQFLGE